MAEQAWKVWIDGASRGNPGEAAYALVIERPGSSDYEEADQIGKTTNNIAEYTALLRALERAEQLGGRRLEIFSDSELLVKQMNGEYRVKNAELKALHALASKRVSQFDRVTLTHVRREQNARADAMCNAALDGRPIRPQIAAGATSQQKAETKSRASAPGLRNEILACLSKAAEEWVESGDATKPDPAEVWQELWAILNTAANGK
jgi:ribonuclease HI